MNNIYIPCMDRADPMDVGFLMGKSSHMGKKDRRNIVMSNLRLRPSAICNTVSQQ